MKGWWPSFDEAVASGAVYTSAVRGRRPGCRVPPHTFIAIAISWFQAAQPRVRTYRAARRDGGATCKPASARISGDGPKLRPLWTANETDAVFDETAISQPVKYVHHLV